MLWREIEQGTGKSVGSACIFSVVKESFAEKEMFECLTQNSFITSSQILDLISRQQPPNLFI